MMCKTTELVINGQTSLLTEGITLVGRGEDADITVDTAKLSRVHCRFHITGTEIAVEDLGSRNGTYINGSRIGSRTVLKPEDILKLADLTASVRFPKPKALNGNGNGHGKTRNGRGRIKNGSGVKNAVIAAVLLIIGLIVWTVISGYVAPELAEARESIEAGAAFCDEYEKPVLEDIPDVLNAVQTLAARLSVVPARFESEFRDGQNLMGRLTEIRAELETRQKEEQYRANAQAALNAVSEDTEINAAIVALERVAINFPDTDAAEAAVKRIADLKRKAEKAEYQYLQDTCADARRLGQLKKYKEADALLAEAQARDFHWAQGEALEPLSEALTLIHKEARRDFERFCTDSISRAETGDCVALAAGIEREYEKIGFSELEEAVETARARINTIRQARIARARAAIAGKLREVEKLQAAWQYQAAAQACKLVENQITENELRKVIHQKRQACLAADAALAAVISHINASDGLTLASGGSVFRASAKGFELTIEDMAQDLAWSRLRAEEYAALLKHAVADSRDGDLQAAAGQVLLGLGRESEADRHLVKALRLKGKAMRKEFPEIFAAYDKRQTIAAAPTAAGRSRTVKRLPRGTSLKIAAPAGIRTFRTTGHTMYHLRPACVEGKGTRALAGAAYDGAVMCWSVDGPLLWEANIDGAFPFDMEAADIDRDGRDEILVAGSNGKLYAFDHDGRALWEYTSPAPLYQVRAARLPGGAITILTGGVERRLVSLSGDGRVTKQIDTPHIVRTIAVGNIRGDGRDYAAVATVISGLGGPSHLQLYDPKGLKPVWSKASVHSTSVFDCLAADLNNDGKDEILLSQHWAEGRARWVAFNGQGKRLMQSGGPQRMQGAYYMNRLTWINLKGSKNPFVLGLVGNQMITYKAGGQMDAHYVAGLAFANAVFDPATNMLWLAGSESGGDCVHGLDMRKGSWAQAYKNLKPGGRLAQVEKNWENLRRQVKSFRKPAYQPKPRKTHVICLRTGVPPEKNFKNVDFTIIYSLTERFNRSSLPGGWKTRKDHRRPYNMTADQIIAKAREYEAQKQDFALWAGHSLGPWYMQLSTMEGVLKAAPKHFKAFVFAELSHINKDMELAIKHLILPLAEKCRQYGSRKIVFINKNIFWTGDAHHPQWAECFQSGKYADVMVPGMEETNCRSQELSLAGRVGLWMGGKVDHWAARVVTDNGNYSRLWEWSSQEKLHHMLRALILRASLGADVYFNSSIDCGDKRSLDVFYEMIEKGVIHIPTRNQLVSLAGVALEMKTPAKEFLHSGGNGHNINYFKGEAADAVFDRLDCYWAGAPLAKHDFSSYAYGVRRRMLNFLPVTPYGLVPILPAGSKLPEGICPRRIGTDGRSFIMAGGSKRGAVEYRPAMEAMLQSGARGLPVLVEGEVSWSASRLDKRHIRIILLDPGYIEPGDRQASIRFPAGTCLGAQDILSGSSLALRDGKVNLTVPAGSVRIIDIIVKGK